MTIKLSSLKVDLEREQQGDWIDYPEWPGVRFNVSSINKPAYMTARDVLMARLVRKHKKNVPPEVMTSEFGRLYAEHLLHGWEGLDEEYTPERARTVLTDPSYREVVKAVEWCAGQVAQVDAEFVEDAAKNSGQPSGGGRKAAEQTAG
ncbi:MAG: hypothetical protein Rhirs2KO_18470 [Rhizobiaceae bacterium]